MDRAWYIIHRSRKIHFHDTCVVWNITKATIKFYTLFRFKMQQNLYHASIHSFPCFHFFFFFFGGGGGGGGRGRHVTYLTCNKLTEKASLHFSFSVESLLACVHASVYVHVRICACKHMSSLQPVAYLEDIFTVNQLLQSIQVTRGHSSKRLLALNRNGDKWPFVSETIG